MKIYCGIYQDGLEFKVSFLKKHKKKITVLKNLVLPYLVNEPILDMPSNKLISTDGLIIEDENVEASASSLLTLMEHYPIEELNFIPVISEPNIAYLILNGSSLQSGGNLKNTIKKLWENKLNRNVNESMLDYVEYKNKNIVSTFINGEIQLLNELKNLSQVINIKSLEILPVRSADISLINYFFRFYKPQKYQQYLLLYVGADLLRMIFISGNNVVHINDYLSIGTQRSELLSFITSKILYEMEIAGVTSISDIIVTGDIAQNLISALKQNFPFTKIEPLNLSVFNVNVEDEQLVDTIQAYSIPLLAVLDTIYPYSEIKHDLKIHSKRVSKLSIFKKFDFLSVLGIVLIFYILHFSKTIHEKNRLVLEELMLNLDKLSKAENQTSDYSRLNSLNADFYILSKYSSMLEKLTSEQSSFSPLLDKINLFNPINNGLWLTDIKTDDGLESSLTIRGLALDRIKIPEFSKIFSESEIKNIYIYEIRNKKIFQFEILVKKI